MPPFLFEPILLRLHIYEGLFAGFAMAAQKRAAMRASPSPRFVSKSVFVVFILTLFRPTLTRVALLANAAPGMIPLSTSASSASATSALRLKGAAHLVAIDGARKSQGHGSSLYLHTKRHVVSNNASSHGRGSARVLKRATQFGPILLDLHCALLGTTPALP
jgi:hypothetical protein